MCAPSSPSLFAMAYPILKSYLYSLYYNYNILIYDMFYHKIKLGQLTPRTELSLGSRDMFSLMCSFHIIIESKHAPASELSKLRLALLSVWPALVACVRTNYYIINNYSPICRSGNYSYFAFQSLNTCIHTVWINCRHFAVSCT